MAMNNDLVLVETLKKNIRISKDNPEDLIGHNGRIFIAVELIDKAFNKTPAVDLIDKIASFFEREENWVALKNCWLENDRSDDLRKLLYKTLTVARSVVIQ